MLLVVRRVVTTTHLVTHTSVLWPGLLTYTNSFSFATDAGFLVFLSDSDLPDEVDGP